MRVVKFLKKGPYKIYIVYIELIKINFSIN